MLQLCQMHPSGGVVRTALVPALCHSETTAMLSPLSLHGEGVELGVNKGLNVQITLQEGCQRSVLFAALDLYHRRGG